MVTYVIFIKAKCDGTSRASTVLALDEDRCSVSTIVDDLKEQHGCRVFVTDDPIECDEVQATWTRFAQAELIEWRQRAVA